MFPGSGALPRGGEVDLGARAAMRGLAWPERSELEPLRPRSVGPGPRRTPILALRLLPRPPVQRRARPPRSRRPRGSWTLSYSAPPSGGRPIGRCEVRGYERTIPMPPGLPDVPLPIETPRLVLRLPSRRDLPDLRRSFRDPRNARAVGAPLHPRSEMRDPALLVSRTWREYRRGEHLSLSVVLRDPPVCIGRVGLRGLDWTYRKVESLSYWIDPTYWNRGYATEASWFLCHAAFRHLGMRRIGSSSLDLNRASRAVHRRLGFVEEGREREAVRIKGRSLDMIHFGLLKRELPSWGKVSKAAGISARSS